MKIKTSKDMAPSLMGAGFRRMVCDGRSLLVREIMTTRRLRRRSKAAPPPRTRHA